MIILSTDLKKEDHEYISAVLKMYAHQREIKARPQAKPGEKPVQEKNFDKIFNPLAERAQVESMQLYCENLSPMSSMNSKIVSNFHQMEHKSKKEPREYRALAAFYKWYVDYYKFSYKSINVEDLEEYRRYAEYYKLAGQMLSRIGKTDLIAKESAFLMQKRNRELLSPEEYARKMSNSRNAIYAAANQQTNDKLRLKLMVRYCENLINWAPDAEYQSRQSTVANVVASVQRNMLMIEEMKKD